MDLAALHSESIDNNDIKIYKKIYHFMWMELMPTLEIIGRVIIGSFFLIAGVRHFLNFKHRITVVKTNYGWFLPAPVMAAGFATQAVAGLALIAGYWILPAVVALIAFLVVATPLYHNMFMHSGPERERHLYMILVNFSLAAALLLIAADAM